MKYKGLAIASILLGMASFASAQQSTFNPELGNGRWSAVQPAISPAYTQGTYFNAEIGNAPAIMPHGSASATNAGAGPTGKLDLASSVRLGKILLTAGNYRVRHINSMPAHFVEFSRIVENDYAPEGQSVYQRQVVARVDCTMQPSSSVFAHTVLEPKNDGATARLEIAGEKAVHLF